MEQQHIFWHTPACSVQSRDQLLISCFQRHESDRPGAPEMLHFVLSLIAARKNSSFKFTFKIFFSVSECRLLLSITWPGCQTEHMVCKAVFRFFVMEVSMSCPPVTNLVPCVLWKGTAKDLVLPQQKEKECFVFKQIKVIILLSELRLLIFFLLHLLPLTVFLFFLGKMMWKF